MSVKIVRYVYYNIVILRRLQRICARRWFLSTAHKNIIYFSHEFKSIKYASRVRYLHTYTTLHLCIIRLTHCLSGKMRKKIIPDSAVGLDTGGR